MNSGKCDGCGAEIFWIKTTDGQPMPVDTPKRIIMIPANWTQGENGKMTDDIWISVSGYQSHFATCPQAAEFRKSKS